LKFIKIAYTVSSENIAPFLIKKNFFVFKLINLVFIK
jgi:hypothetical protein